MLFGQFGNGMKNCFYYLKWRAFHREKGCRREGRWLRVKFVAAATGVQQLVPSAISLRRSAESSRQCLHLSPFREKSESGHFSYSPSPAGCMRAQ